MKTHTIALVISAPEPPGTPFEPSFEVLHDEEEIEYFERATQQGSSEAMREILSRRAVLNEQEEMQADYIEEVLSRPFNNTTIQEQGLLWFKSKIKMESHRKAESEAAQMIAEYAFHIYQLNPSRTDFTLSGSKSQVRVKIFHHQK